MVVSIYTVPLPGIELSLAVLPGIELSNDSGDYH
jgi:hypothetical protein